MSIEWITTAAALLLEGYLSKKRFIKANFKVNLFKKCNFVIKILTKKAGPPSETYINFRIGSTISLLFAIS
jgi:hypothetical protein